MILYKCRIFKLTGCEKMLGILFIKLLVSTIFFSSGISKIINYNNFKNSVKQFSNKFSNINNVLLLSFSSGGVIFLEITSAIYFFVSDSKFICIFLIFMLVVFSLMVIYKLKAKQKIYCNCGGFLGNYIISKEIPIRNFILVLGLLYVLFFPIQNFKFNISEIILLEIVVLFTLYIYSFIKKANLILNQGK